MRVMGIVLRINIGHAGTRPTPQDQRCSASWNGSLNAELKLLYLLLRDVAGDIRGRSPGSH